MIHSFSCKNFYSFKDFATVNFVVNDKAPDNYGYFMAKSGKRLSKIETIIGANASGKTNMLRVLPFMKWLIVDSYARDPASSIPVKSFAFTGEKNKLSEVAADFEIDGNIYSYEFCLNDKRILSEKLSVTNKSSKKVTKKMVFCRTWDKATSNYVWEDALFQLPKGFMDLDRGNASVVSSAFRLGHLGSQKIVDGWKKVEFNVKEFGWIGDLLSPDSGRYVISAVDFYSKPENASQKKQADEILASFDLGLKSIDLKKEADEAGNFKITVRGVHIFDNGEGNLPFQYESAGTRQLFVLLKTVLSVLSQGGVAVLDEMDASLHPEIVLALVNLFLQPEKNRNNAQLIFATHGHSILNSLDKYQIMLVEKKDHGGSEVWRLDDVSGIRSDENYYSKYMAGAYGAVPRI